MTPSSLEAEELCELAERQGLILMVGHTFEYNPWVEKLRELIQGDVLGEIHYIDSARLNLGLYQRDHNVIWDLAPHDFSIISFLLNGDETERISARGAALVIPNRHDIVHIDGLFSKSIYTNIHVSWLYPLKVRRTTVVGSKKMVVFNDVTDDEKLKIYDKNVFFPQEDGSGQFIDFTPSYFQGDIVIPNVKASEPLKNECKHFLDCIKTGKEARSSGRVGLKVVKMLEKADLTLREQAWQPALVAN
jgi:predicted dehydrogenase